MDWLFIAFILVLGLSGVIFGLRKAKEKKPAVSTLLAVKPNQLNDKSYLDLVEMLTAQRLLVQKLAEEVARVPVKTLNTIQGSANSMTGKMGELVTTLALQAQYDRLMPLGDVVDFIGIKYPEGEDPGRIDFIEVKTGDRAVLNADQKKVQKIITSHKDKISFKLVKVEVK